MAFLSRVGSILKQSVTKQITSQISASNPSIHQSLRCMSSSKLFVGGLAWGVDDSSLRDVFSQYGDVVEARVIIDREQNRSRGFGFVTFASTEEASSAIQAMDGQDLQGRAVRVNYATERAPRPYGGGFGSGGGGGYGGGQNYGGGGGYGGGQNYGGGGGYGGGQNYGGGGGYGGGQNYGGGGGYGGGQNYGGSNYDGGAPQQYGGDSGGFNSGGGSSGGVGDSFFGGGAAGTDVTSEKPESGFSSSGFEDTVGVGGSGQFGNSAAGADDAGQFESSGPLEESFKDDDEPNDYAKRA